MNYKKFVINQASTSNTQFSKSFKFQTDTEYGFVTGISFFTVQGGSENFKLGIDDEAGNHIIEPLPVEFWNLSNENIDRDKYFIPLHLEAGGKQITFFFETEGTNSEIEIHTLIRFDNDVRAPICEYSYQLEEIEIPDMSTLNDGANIGFPLLTLDRNYEKVIGFLAIYENITNAKSFALGLFKSNGEMILEEIPMSFVLCQSKLPYLNRFFSIESKAKGTQIKPRIELLNKNAPASTSKLQLIFQLERTKTQN